MLYRSILFSFPSETAFVNNRCIIIPKSLESQTNVIYKIPCGDCSWCYIGETGRAFNTRKKEHLRNVKTAAKGSRIANHVWANSHAIDFDNASIIDKGGFRTRKILEAWHSKLTPNADNNSCPLPGQYNILFNKHSWLSAFLIFTLYFTPIIFYLFIILPVEGCRSLF